MLMFLHGKDSFRIHERVGILRRGFQDKYDTVGAQVETMNASDMSPDDIRSRILTQGLFTNKRFLHVSNIFDLKEAAAETFIEVAPSAGEDAIIVATVETIPKKKKPKYLAELKVILTKADRVEEYKPLTDLQVMQWAKKRIQEREAEIDADALTYVLQSTGNDLWQLHHTIEQLTHYTKKITKPDAELFVDSPLDEDIFHFSDALAERNAERALKLLHDQLSSGAHPLYLLTMIARQVSILIEVKETDGKGSSLHPYVIKKARQHAQRFDLDELIHMHSRLTEIDFALKSSRKDPILLLDQFVVESIQQTPS